MIVLDGSYGEGGGQIVRTALALSALTGKSFKVERIRAGRKKPGLKSQHLHSITALQQLCNAKASGAYLGSEKLEFIPGKLAAKNLKIDIGTAGSITLLMQSLIIPAMFGDRTSIITVTGGTDTRWSMPVDYFSAVVAPILRDYCKRFEVKLLKRGYYPKGEGVVRFEIEPRFSLGSYGSSAELLEDLQAFRCLDISRKGKLALVKGVSHASSDLQHARVAERQAKAAELYLTRLQCPVSVRVEYSAASSTGSGITLYAISTYDDKQTMVGGDALGEPNTSAEKVGSEAAKMLLDSLGSVTDKHLADNLVPFLGLFGGKIATSEVTEHTKANIHVVEKFLPVEFSIVNNAISCRSR